MARLRTVSYECVIRPGCGKSLLLQHILPALPPETTFVTATTGLAAAALGGTTLNAFAGVGRAEGPLEALIRAASRPDPLRRWRQAAVLIIDEVRPLEPSRHSIPSNLLDTALPPPNPAFAREPGILRAWAPGYLRDRGIGGGGLELSGIC
jgi:PIF1-like helicase